MYRIYKVYKLYGECITRQREKMLNLMMDKNIDLGKSTSYTPKDSSDEKKTEETESLSRENSEVNNQIN